MPSTVGFDQVLDLIEGLPLDQQAEVVQLV